MIQLSSIGFLLLGLIFTTSSAFAYWNDVTTSRTVELVTVGEPVRITFETVQTVGENVTLVPEGRVITNDQIDSAEFIYDVGVSEELLKVVSLNIYVDKILINGLTEYSHLIQVNILNQGDKASIDIENDIVRIFVKVTLLEPIDAEEALEKGLDESTINVEDSEVAFNTITGQNISFELIFELEEKDSFDNNN